jgi:competence protein ComEA
MRVLLAAVILAFGFAAHAAPPPSAVAPACQRMNANVASTTDLDTLPGVGDARAKAIVDGRPYATVDDVRKAVPQVFAQIKSCLFVESVNVNSATAADLSAKLPGIGSARASAIVAGRPYGKPDDLVSKGVLTKGVLDGIRPLVTTR